MMYFFQFCYVESKVLFSFLLIAKVFEVFFYSTFFYYYIHIIYVGAF
jgi:hypothetical protein